MTYMESRWDVRKILSGAVFGLLVHRSKLNGFIHSLKRLTLLCGVLLLAVPGHAQPPYPPTLYGTGDLPSSALKKKWNPGHYVQILRNKAAWTWEGRKEVFDEVGRDADFEGVFVPYRWSDLEGNKGDYSAGIASVRRDLKYLESLPHPKQLVLKIIDKDNSFGDSTPDYIARNSAFKVSPFTQWCRWNAKAMDHYIDMLRAYAKAFDDHPRFEGVVLYKETVVGRARAARLCGYSDGDYLEQTKRLMTEATALFRTSNVILATNSLGGQDDMDKLVAHLASVGGAMGGPDVLPPDCTSQGRSNGGQGLPAYRSARGDTGGPDYRKTVPGMWSIEVSEMGGSLGTCTPHQLGTFANTSLRATHLAWDRNGWAGNSATQWEAIKRWVADPANALSNAACPKSYRNGCRTDGEQ